MYLFLYLQFKISAFSASFLVDESQSPSTSGIHLSKYDDRTMNAMQGKC